MVELRSSERDNTSSGKKVECGAGTSSNEKKELVNDGKRVVQ